MNEIVKQNSISSSNIIKIYCDESGFTGNNLLHPQQEFFSFSSVATDENEAENVVTDLIKKYNVQNNEIKGGNLVKYNKGRKAITEILDIFEGRFKVAFFDKKFALAGKFFEYIFEPCIAEKNSIFYQNNFHKFISNGLYGGFSLRGTGAEELFEEFESLMRKKDINQLKKFFTTPNEKFSSFFENISDFVLSHLDEIEAELQSLQGTGAGKWVLDLTNTALYTLLCEWGEKYEQLDVYCDDSKPLQTYLAMFEVMVNRYEKKYAALGDKEFPITFNLTESIKLVDSKTNHGIQIADAIAAAFIYIVREKDDYSKEWSKHIPDATSYGSVIPDPAFIDLDSFQVKVNALILMELHRRSLQKIPLLEAIEKFIHQSKIGLLAEQSSKS